MIQAKTKLVTNHNQNDNEKQTSKYLGDLDEQKSQTSNGSRQLKQNGWHIAKFVSPPGVLLPDWGGLTRRPIENAGAWSRTARTALLGS